MRYNNVETAIFRARPNRFIAHVELNGELVVCHVKNTGRCKELLIPGTRVVLAKAGNPARKTQYDLIAVWKNDMLVNIDSQAPNAAFLEWARADLDAEILPEQRFGSSRFDFYYNSRNSCGFIEVKGVTLENEGVARFPDAPTVRGARHVRELIEVKNSGMEAQLVFVVQMQGMQYVAPNRATDPDFAAALAEAHAAGVKIVALECEVLPDAMTITRPIPVRIDM